MKRLLLILALLVASPAWAAVQVEVGTFTANTGGTTTTVTTGFQGKAVILWTDSNIAEGETNGALYSIGFSDGTNGFDLSWAGDNAVATTNVGRFADNKPIYVMATGDPTYSGRVTGIAFNATPNMVLTWESTPSAAWKINYLLIGGADVTNAFVGNTGMRTTTGTQNVTGVGFQGDAVLLLAFSNAAFGGYAQANVGVGFATSATKRWAWSGSVYDGQTTSAAVNGMSKLSASKVIIIQDYSANTDYVSADFMGFTADGFDLNYTAAPSTAYKLGYLVIKGGQWDCGTQAKPATATTQTVTGMSWQPKVLGLLMSSPTALDTYSSNNISTFGAATSTSARAYAGAYHNDAINTVGKRSIASNLISHEMNATANADFTSFNSDGWTITWDATGTAYQVGWFTVGDTAAGGSASTTLTGGITFSGGVTMAQQSIIFQSNAETADISDWTGTNYSGCLTSSVAANTVRPHSGSYSFEFYYEMDQGTCGNPAQDINRTLYKNPITTNGLDEWYTEAWVYLASPISPGVKDGVQRKLLRWTPDAPGTDTWSFLLTTDGADVAGVPKLYPRLSFTGTGCSVPTYSPTAATARWDYDTWYHFKIYIKLNTPGSSDGLFIMWANDEEIWNLTGQNYRNTCSTKFKYFSMGDQANRTTMRDIKEYRYSDDVQIYTIP